MATKKKLAKALRQLSQEVNREPLMVAHNKSKLFGQTVKIESGVTTNPYRRLKRSFKRGELSKMQVLTINELTKTF